MYTAFTLKIHNKKLLKVFDPRNRGYLLVKLQFFCTVAKLFPVISIVNYLNCTLIARVKSSIPGNKVFNCNCTVNRL